jgi:hypothetical protein
MGKVDFDTSVSLDGYVAGLDDDLSWHRVDDVRWSTQAPGQTPNARSRTDLAKETLERQAVGNQYACPGGECSLPCIYPGRPEHRRRNVTLGVSPKAA